MPERQDIVLIKIDEDGNILNAATLASVEDDNITMVKSIGNQELLLGGTTRVITPLCFNYTRQYWFARRQSNHLEYKYW